MMAKGREKMNEYSSAYHERVDSLKKKYDEKNAKIKQLFGVKVDSQ